MARMEPEINIFVLGAYLQQHQNWSLAKVGPEMTILLLRIYSQEHQNWCLASVGPEMTFLFYQGGINKKTPELVTGQGWA